MINKNGENQTQTLEMTKQVNKVETPTSSSSDSDNSQSTPKDIVDSFENPFDPKQILKLQNNSFSGNSSQGKLSASTVIMAKQMAMKKKNASATF